MAKEKEPDPGSVARAKRIHKQIDRLKNKGREGTPSGPEDDQPRSLRDIVHDRMDKLDRNKPD